MIPTSSRGFSLAVPISEPNGRVVAALHVGGLYDANAERRAMEEMLPRLRVAALKLSGRD
jgi:DNA-binding IclR family transcriptional regulator